MSALPEEIEKHLPDEMKGKIAAIIYEDGSFGFQATFSTGDALVGFMPAIMAKEHQAAALAIAGVIRARTMGVPR